MRIFNRRASFNFELGEKIEAGIALTGPETKSVYEGKISLDEAFAKLRNGEIWLFNCHIHPYRFAETAGIDPTRPRKLLLHRKEILSLEAKMKQKNLTLVPTACYTKNRKIKIELALARAKKNFEKRKKSKGMTRFDEMVL